MRFDGSCITRLLSFIIHCITTLDSTFFTTQFPVSLLIKVSHFLKLLTSVYQSVKIHSNSKSDIIHTENCRPALKVVYTFQMISNQRRYYGHQSEISSGKDSGTRLESFVLVSEKGLNRLQGNCNLSNDIQAYCFCR